MELAETDEDIALRGWSLDPAEQSNWADFRAEDSQIRQPQRKKKQETVAVQKQRRAWTRKKLA